LALSTLDFRPSGERQPDRQKPHLFQLVVMDGGVTGGFMGGTSASGAA
jgi:hypothetical protein